MNCELINAKNEDLERIKNYKLKTILEYAENLTVEEKERIIQYVNNEVKNQILKYQKIVFKNNIIGCILLKKIDNGILLDEIFIEEAYQNQGLGTTILQNILKDTHENIYLWVYKKNEKAIHVYQKLGFQILKETDTRYFMVLKKLSP